MLPQIKVTKTDDTAKPDEKDEDENVSINTNLPDSSKIETVKPTPAEVDTQKPKTAEEEKKDAAEKSVYDKKTLDAKKARTAEQKKKSLKIILGYAKAEWFSFSLGMFYLFLGSASDFVVPLYIGFVINALETGNFEQVGPYCWQLFIIVLVSGAFVGLRASTFNIMSEKIAVKLRKDFYDSVINKDVEFFENNRTGDLLSRLNADTTVVQDAISTNVSMLVRCSVFIVATIVVLFILSPILAATTFVGIIPIVTFSVKFGYVMKDFGKAISAEKAKMSTIADETLNNVRIVKAFCTEEDEIKKFTEYSTNVYKIGLKKAYWTGFFGFFVQLCLYGAMALIIYIASILYERDMITIGRITSFLFYMIMLLFQFWVLSYVFGNAMNIIGTSDKIVEILSQTPKINTTGGIAIEEDKVDGNIELRNVKFTYPTKKDVQVLKGVSFQVDCKKNRVVALCGTSGCGKSSIIAMIERFYDPDEGQVLFNGVDIRELDPRWYHEHVAIVQQEPILFSGSVRENILYGLNWEGYSEDQIIARIDEACKQANAYDFLHDLDLFPLVYETVVGERGVKLSGGQKQRVAIARALIRKPKVLLLDEATSALDAESEHQVQQALDVLIKSGSQTTIIVAHRLSTIRDADEIIVMQHGEIKERGNHDQLFSLNGIYKNLVNRQMVSEEITKNL